MIQPGRSPPINPPPSHRTPPSHPAGRPESSKGGGPRVTYTVPDGWENIGYGVIKRDPTVAVILVGADDHALHQFLPDDDRGGSSAARSARPLTTSSRRGRTCPESTPPRRGTSLSTGSTESRSSSRSPTTKWRTATECITAVRSVARPRPAASVREPVGKALQLAMRPSQAHPGQHQKIWVLDVDGSRLMISHGPSRIPRSRTEPPSTRSWPPSRSAERNRPRQTPFARTAATAETASDGGERRMPVFERVGKADVRGTVRRDEALVAMDLDAVRAAKWLSGLSGPATKLRGPRCRWQSRRSQRDWCC